MMVVHFVLLSLLLLHLQSTYGALVYHWPDPKLDQLENNLYRNDAFAGLTAGCQTRDNSTIAAQWLRIAYHDMATHNAEDGTGGLDGSIVFELDRPQNVGEGMRDSLIDFGSATNNYIGVADTIAMGAVLAVAACGGPAIPFRPGRIDATQAGPATVPEPQQDLDSHIASFKRQGFNQTEMIALVACGHTLGGVRQKDFPFTVIDSAFDDFDSTHQFDTAVVTEYLLGATKNPLVVGANTTTNSDMRIFSSDGNVTMQNLSSPETFNEICSNLIERMINTVPSEVTLTDVVEPIEYKINRVSLYPQSGALVLNATFRTLESSASNVTMRWQGKNGCLCPELRCSVPPKVVKPAPPSEYATQLGIHGITLHEFSATVDLNCSISKFWFEINNADGSSPLIIDNGGSGYEVDDTVLFDPFRSFLATNTPPGSLPFRIVIGIRETLAADANVSMQIYERGNPFPPKITTVDMVADPINLPANGYTFFTAEADFGSASSGLVQADVGGKNHELFISSDDLTGPL